MTVLGRWSEGSMTVQWWYCGELASKVGLALWATVTKKVISRTELRQRPLKA